ncbi:hypothetical protein KY342_05460, partial [Candidatus Woesearchaeota archaeon]|nr:hypothetical protein [Candidatus Woesearchaeota archaeon]
EMIKRYRTTVFRFAGSNTPGFLKKEIAEELIKEGLDIKYTTFGHVGDDVRDFELLKESGCYSLFFGIESGSQRILEESINKLSGGRFVKIQQIIAAINICKKAGIYTVGSVIIPAPLETEETKKESLDLLLNRIKIDSVLVSLPGVVLGTEWERNHEKYNIVYLNPETFDKDLMIYKIKLLAPPILWDPFPYKINGKPFKEYAKESNDFAQALEENGILTQAPDEMLLMAHLAEMPAREFRDRMRQCFSLGNYKELKKIIGKINYNSFFTE